MRRNSVAIIMRCLVVSICLVAGCTKPNPLNCADGNCNDVNFPFCDVDGTLEGSPFTCIAVACTPQEFAECRGDDAIVCDSTGSNYTVTKCERGCDPASHGCVACTDNAQCIATNPVCDSMTHSCRACAQDSECASDVCDKPTGTCQDKATVVYASPDGIDIGVCGDQNHPCTMRKALELISPTRPAVKLAMGTYQNVNFSLVGQAVPTVTVFGSGATMVVDSIDKVSVSDGARLLLRDLTFKIDASASTVIDCTTSTGTPSTVDLDNITFAGTAPTNSVISATACDVSITNGRFDRIGSAVTASKGGPQSRPSTVTLDRCVVNGSSITGGTISSDPSLILLTNSLALQASIRAGVEVRFSTLIDSPIFCIQLFEPFPRVSNSILFGHGATDVVTGSPGLCTFAYDVMTPQVVDPNGDHLLRNVDPKFKNPVLDDYHLTLGSPAIDASDPTAMSARDLDGTSRPQGAARDIGAFEFH